MTDSILILRCPCGSSRTAASKNGLQCRLSLYFHLFCFKGVYVNLPTAGLISHSDAEIYEPGARYLHGRQALGSTPKRLSALLLAYLSQ